MEKKSVATLQCTKGKRVKVALLREDGQFKNDFTRKFLRLEGQIGTIVDSASILLNGTTVIVFDVQIDHRRVSLIEDCLELV
jgi:hypothetical protein